MTGSETTANKRRGVVWSVHVKLLNIQRLEAEVYYRWYRLSGFFNRLTVYTLHKAAGGMSKQYSRSNWFSTVRAFTQSICSRRMPLCRWLFFEICRTNRGSFWWTLITGPAKFASIVYTRIRAHKCWFVGVQWCGEVAGMFTRVWIAQICFTVLLLKMNYVV